MSHHLAIPRRLHPHHEPEFQRIGRRDILPPATLEDYKVTKFNQMVQFSDFSSSLEMVADEFQDVAHPRDVATITKPILSNDTPNLYEIMKATMPAYFSEETAEEKAFKDAEEEMEWPIEFFDICIPPSATTDLVLE